MGQDYSYSQPSSSDEFDITSLLQAEAELYADEAESSYNMAWPFQNPPQPEADDGIPTTCYCGGEPVVATSYTSKDPGRRELKDQSVVNASKLVKLERNVGELSKKEAEVIHGFALEVYVMEELERITTTVSDLESVCIKSDTDHSLTMDNTTSYVNLL
ncbi:hypothetical protein DY000_02024569 [Brassica cretica]|uniref:Uncharacterized protein n=1 Tax=Brassica cretica TaxID=69181 RepID=A0ABQ7EMJ7_BRACR|nr:hypothetical protein DY000_02024569 [Brassica cretica]